jgi:carbamoyl-phosphate synthase large subunit
MVGATFDELRTEGLVPRGRIITDHVSVKEAVLPFSRFPDVDTVLGPEMRSTGEVMGIDRTFGLAFAKSQMAAGSRLPSEGTVFFSLADRDKAGGLDVARSLLEQGFALAATLGTAGFLRDQGLDVAHLVAKVGEGSLAGDAVEMIRDGQIQLVINTPRGRGPRADGAHIRKACIEYSIPCLTTLSAARAATQGIRDWASHPLEVISLQELHAALKVSP